MSIEDFFGTWLKVIPKETLFKALNVTDSYYQGCDIYPVKDNAFNAFLKCPYELLRVIIIGDTPYISNYSTGLAYACDKSLPYENWPESLKVLRTNVEKFCNYDLPFSNIDTVFPTLEQWAEQGVLLLNYPLITTPSKAAFLEDTWKNFTKDLVKNLVRDKNYTIFVLLGERAKYLQSLIPDNRLVLGVSPKLKIGFTDIFRKVDEKCQEFGIPLIYWI